MSSIFFSKISVIDHAKLTSFGPVGGSYNLSAIASLDHDAMGTEQVVVDFSSGKKEIKKVIDAHNFEPTLNGFDHKLWVPSDANIKHFPDGSTEVEDEFVFVRGPTDMFKVVSNARHEISNRVRIISDMENLIKTALPREQYSVILDDDPYPNLIADQYCCESSTRMFSYTHGLAESSSFGCKNILHGHKSFVRVLAESEYISHHIAEMISSHLDGAYIYNAKHSPADRVIDYTTTRGHMRLEFNDYPGLKMIRMEVEPTIENIIDYVCSIPEIANETNELPMTIMISEGLQKGAIKSFNCKGVK